jgi:hypothetical protein
MTTAVRATAARATSDLRRCTGRRRLRGDAGGTVVSSATRLVGVAPRSGLPGDHYRVFVFGGVIGVRGATRRGPELTRVPGGSYELHLGANRSRGERPDGEPPPRGGPRARLAKRDRP